MPALRYVISWAYLVVRLRACPRFVGGNEALAAVRTFLALPPFRKNIRCCHVGVADARIVVKQRESIHPVRADGVDR